jgi:hypothetical protein
LRTIAAFICGLILASSAQSQELQSLESIFDSAAQRLPLSFPEKITVSPSGNIYLLDTELSNIFISSSRGHNLSRLCAPRAPASASDVSVDRAGNIWILDSANARIVRLNRNCQVQSSFECRKNDPLKLQLNSFGEAVVLMGFGDTLFDVYNSRGELLHSFGQRIQYGNSDTDRVLSNGNLVADRAGGFYLSFNFPPLIRHYARDGRLLSEFKPESDVVIKPPFVSARRQVAGLTISSRYQILVLDMAVDNASHLYLLMSGKNHAQARSEGSRLLLVTTATGKTLKKIPLEDNFHRLAANGSALYLLKNRDALRLKKYALP